MHAFRVLPLIFGVALLYIIGSVLFVRFQIRPVDLSQEIHVASSGAAYQGSTLVGQALNEDGGDTLQIQLITPQTTNAYYDNTVRIVFDAPAQVALRPTVTSIQGTADSTVEWLDDKTLLILFAGYVPDSQTSLQLHSATPFFTIPLGLRAWSSIKSISEIGWGLTALFIVIIAAGLGRWRRWSMRWKPATPNSTLPENLSPLEVAILHHSTLRPIDLMASLYHIAHRGYLQIIEHDDTVLFLRTNKAGGLLRYEEQLLLILFPEQGRAAHLEDIVSSLDHELFSAVVSQLYVDVYDQFSQKHYFYENPRNTHLWYKTVGIVTQLSGLIVTVLSYFLLLRDAPGLEFVGLAVFVVGSLVYRLGKDISPLAKAGFEIIHRLEAFKSYLEAPDPIGNDDQMGLIFYEQLPYALVLGNTQAWHDRFGDTRWYVPDWYETGGTTFTVEAFLAHVFGSVDTLSKLLVTLKDPNVD